MDSQEMKVRKGQAFNLAVNDAISVSKQDDAKYIYARFIWYYNMANVVQGSDLDMIASVLDKPDFIAAVEQLKGSIK